MFVVTSVVSIEDAHTRTYVETMGHSGTRCKKQAVQDDKICNYMQLYIYTVYTCLFGCGYDILPLNDHSKLVMVVSQFAFPRCSPG